MTAKTFLMALSPALAAALGVAAMILIASALVLRGQKLARWRAAMMPPALAAGFIAGYAVLFELPQSLSDRLWKMSLFVALFAGVLLAAIRVTPKLIGILLAAILVAGVTFLLVRQSSEGWLYFLVGLVIGLVIYLLSLLPAWHDQRLWLWGPVLMWLCFTTASGPVLFGIDQILGRMLILLACLAGLAAVAGLYPPLRLAASASGPFLAVMYATILLLAINYNPGFPESPTIPLKAFILLACGPLAAAVGWLPAFRRHPWWGLMLAIIIAAGIIIPGAIIAAGNTPSE